MKKLNFTPIFAGFFLGVGIGYLAFAFSYKKLVDSCNTIVGSISSLIMALSIIIGSTLIGLFFAQKEKNIPSNLLSHQYLENTEQKFANQH